MGSGIGALTRGYIDVNKQSQRIFTQVALNSSVDAVASSYPFDGASPVFVFNNEFVQSMSNPVLCWDDSLQCLYVGITATGSFAVEGGVKGIAVFSIKAGVPLLTSLITEAALEGNDDLLLAAHGQDVSVAVHTIQIMHTSTGLSYLIAVVGTEQKEIRVLPLVDNQGQYQGTVASKTSTIQNLYIQSSRYAFFQKRVFDQPAILPTDIFAKTEMPALIGFDQDLSTVLYQNMNDCFIQGDSIFITVNTPDIPEQSGIFFSRALFGSDGRIVGWTLWQKAQQNNDIFLAAADAKQGGFYTATGSDDGHLFTLTKSGWKFGSQSSLAYLDGLLKNYLLSDGYDLSCAKVLFEPHRIDNSILFVSGSNGKLLLNQLGVVSDQEIVVNQAVTTENTAVFIVFSDPILQSIGFISDCSYAYHKDSLTFPDEEFLVVSGSGGVALLAGSDGTGWPLNFGIGNNFSNLPLPASWFIIENQTYIKKVIADEQYLYLIADTQIIRINLNESDFVNGVINKVVIAVIKDFDNTQAFVDFIPSQSHAILATSNGLYYADEQNSVQADSSENIEWKKVILPESVSAIEQIQVVTQSGNPVDITRTVGSQILITATSQSNKRGTIVRAVVDQDGVVTCFDDQRIGGTQSHFIDYGTCIKNSYSDGAFWYSLLKSASFKVRPALIGAVTLEPGTPFLGLIPSYLTTFASLEQFFPRSIFALPIGTMMLTTNKEFSITQ
jgi:hypothetical protein